MPKLRIPCSASQELNHSTTAAPYHTSWKKHALYRHVILFLPEKSSSRHSAFGKMCPSSRRHLSESIRSGIHSLCSQRERNSNHLGSISLTGTSIYVLNNLAIKNYLGQIYPAELEIKDTTESITSASYLYLLLSIWSDVNLVKVYFPIHTSIYDKGDDLNFQITNYPFLSCNIPSSLAHAVF